MKSRDIFPQKTERATMTNYISSANQKILDWLINIIYLGEIKIAIKEGMKSRFDIMGF